MYKREANLQEQWRGRQSCYSSWLFCSGVSLSLLQYLYNHGQFFLVPFYTTSMILKSLFQLGSVKGEVHEDCLPCNVSAEMQDLTSRICWELVKKEGDIAVWQKPLNNSCYLNRDAGAQPPLCNSSDAPDNVWYILVQNYIHVQAYLYMQTLTRSRIIKIFLRSSFV